MSVIIGEITIETAPNVLMKDMSYGRVCLMVGYVLLEDTSYKRVCFSGGNIFQVNMSYRSFVLWEVMLCRRTCHASVHVFIMAYVTVRSVLLEEMSYTRTGLT